MWRRAFYLVVAVAVLVAWHEFGTMVRADGSYVLRVGIAAEATSGVTSVSHICACNERQAAEVVKSFEMHGRSPEMTHSESTEPFTVTLWFSYLVSGSGRTLGYSQPCRYLIVFLHDDDGTTDIHRLNIPHRNVSRHLVVDSKTLINRLVPGDIALPTPSTAPGNQ